MKTWKAALLGAAFGLGTLGTGTSAALAQQARSGKLRVVAVTGERRHPEFPDIPTVRESGYPDFAIYGWSALYTRSETPDDITTRLADAMQKALASNAAQAGPLRPGTQPSAVEHPIGLACFAWVEVVNVAWAVEMQGNTAFLKPLQQGLQELPVVELPFIRQVEALGKPFAQAWLE